MNRRLLYLISYKDNWLSLIAYCTQGEVSAATSILNEVKKLFQTKHSLGNFVMSNVYVVLVFRLTHGCLEWYGVTLEDVALLPFKGSGRGGAVGAVTPPSENMWSKHIILFPPKKY